MNSTNARLVADTLHRIVQQLETVRLEIQRTETPAEYRRHIQVISHLALANTVALRDSLAEHPEIRRQSELEILGPAAERNDSGAE